MNCFRNWATSHDLWKHFPHLWHLTQTPLLADWLHFTSLNSQEHLHFLLLGSSFYVRIASFTSFFDLQFFRLFSSYLYSCTPLKWDGGPDAPFHYAFLQRMVCFEDGIIPASGSNSWWSDGSETTHCELGIPKVPAMDRSPWIASDDRNLCTGIIS